MLEDWNEEVASRLTMLEFMVEVLFARHLAEQPPHVAQTMISELQRLKDKAYGPEADPDALNRVLIRSGEMQDNFLQKAAERSDQIRRAAGR